MVFKSPNQCSHWWLGGGTTFWKHRVLMLKSEEGLAQPALQVADSGRKEELLSLELLYEFTTSFVFGLLRFWKDSLRKPRQSWVLELQAQKRVTRIRNSRRLPSRYGGWTWSLWVSEIISCEFWEPLNKTEVDKYTYLSIWVESQAGYSMCMNIFKNRHSLDVIGIPYADIRLLPDLTSRNQSFIWV